MRCESRGGRQSWDTLRAVNDDFERRPVEVPSIRAHVDELVASANA